MKLDRSGTHGTRDPLGSCPCPDAPTPTIGLILGIDPGPTESAYALVDSSYRVVAAGKVGAGDLIRGIRCTPPAQVVVESIQSYGMVVGRSVFDTCYVIGRIYQACYDRGIPVALYPRHEYTCRICGTNKINDAVLRQALGLRFGGYGETGSVEVIPEGELGAGIYKGGSRKGQPRTREIRIPQPLHALNCTDKRSAYAVAVYHIDLTKHGRRVEDA